MQTPPAGRRLPRALLVAGAIAGGLAIAVVVDVARSGGPGAWLARHRVPVPYVATGQRFDLGGRSLYLDCRGTGSPTIVLEAGSGADSSTWAAVHDELAATNRTCAYDRAGRGRSDPRHVHTLRDAATDLRLLLAAGGAEPPFVVVGHSLGGAYGRVFAATFRSDVAGLVLVDAFGPDLEEAWLHPLLGPLRDEYAARLDGLRSHVAAVDGLDWPTSEDQLRTADFTGLPIEVLVAPRGEPRLDGPANDAIAAAREASARSLSPGHVTYSIAWGAGHEIQFDRPDLVIAAARRLAERAR
jgi:pimeloyl-ACP methyl ester carboxylesterase